METEKKEIPEERKDFPEELYYSADGHYWLKVGKAKEIKNIRQVRIGLTRLGAEIHRIRRINIKPTGTSIAKGTAFAGFIGERAGGLDLPISGTIIELNGDLTQSPQLIYKDPYNTGWIVVIKPSNLEEELKQFQKVTAEGFKKFLEAKLKEESEKPKEPIEPEEPAAPIWGEIPEPFG